MTDVDLILKYQKQIERMCKIKLKYLRLNGDWYVIC